jgi:hypothetical protein
VAKAHEIGREEGSIADLVMVLLALLNVFLAPLIAAAIADVTSGASNYNGPQSEGDHADGAGAERVNVQARSSSVGGKHE